MGRLLGCFDFILHTVSSPHNKQVYNMLWGWIINIQYVFTLLPPHLPIIKWLKLCNNRLTPKHSPTQHTHVSSTHLPTKIAVSKHTFLQWSFGWEGGGGGGDSGRVGKVSPR